ncbi:unnamed protein product [Moneuplotes crassus]|uniref:Rab-GAP TBC domain-containing protein n=1 Tax=Euplotes crassus TaxID=5936 RepID=A0AAD1Y2T6_EUPCR|nr:unnamed protein product [Moneuplotes crassus]
MEERAESYDLCDVPLDYNGEENISISDMETRITQPKYKDMSLTTKSNKRRMKNDKLDQSYEELRHTLMTPPSLHRKNKSDMLFLFRTDKEELRKLRQTQKRVIKRRKLNKITKTFTSDLSNIGKEHAPDLTSEDTEKEQVKMVRKFQRDGRISETDKKTLVILILKNKGLVPKIRKNLWMILTEATKNVNDFPDYYYFPEGYKPLEGRRIHGSNSGLPQVSERHRLLYSYPDMPDIYEQQILLDLDRTFSDIPEFCKENSQNKRILLNILLSYTKRNPQIGYCQGMNYLAATLLRVFDDEELAFWGLCNLCESILPLDYYSHMIEVLVDQKVFVHLLQELMPTLYEHLQNLGLDVALVLFQWFICLFASQFNQQVTEAIWDLIFLEGSVAVFRSSLAILSIMEEDILDASEFSEIYPILNTKPFEVINEPSVLMKSIKKFITLKHERIRELRNQYRPIILEEQAKLSNCQSCIRPPKQESIGSKRIKLLSRFPLLDFFLKDTLTEEGKINEMTLDLCDYSCKENPICLYDFTIRSKSCNFLVYRVGKPIEILGEYFYQEEANKETLKSQNWHIFTSDKPKICNDHTKFVEKDDYKKIQQRKICKYSDDDLLLCRESHLCTREDFHHEFQHLFNKNCNTLLDNDLICNFKGDEKACEAAKNQVLHTLKEENQRNNSPDSQNNEASQSCEENPDHVSSISSEQISQNDFEIPTNEIGGGWYFPDEEVFKNICEMDYISNLEKSSVSRSSEFNPLMALKNREEGSFGSTFKLMSSVFFDKTT